MNSNQALALRDNAKEQLMQIKTIESGKEYLNKIKAIEIWAQAEKKDAELQNVIAEQKIRTQRILGKLIEEGQKRGDIATQAQHGKGVQASIPQENTRKTLSEIGITAKESMTFKAIADIPERVFESFIEEKKEAVDNAVSELTTAGLLRLSGKRNSNMHISDDSYEWFTPDKYIESARRVMGSIDLDPASCDDAQKIVKAKKYYTIEDDGTTKKWKGNVWLNPPYSMPEIEIFIDKVVSLYLSGDVPNAIVLTNNSSDTAWFHKLIDYPFCLTKGRIQFWGIGGEVLATRQGQAIFYLGNNVKIFVTEFSQYGAVVKKICR